MLDQTNYTQSHDTVIASPESSRHSGSDHKNNRKPSVTPHEYADAISFYAKQTVRESLYPGNVFEDLALFLRSQKLNSERRDLGKELLQRPLATLHTIDKVAGHKVQTFSDASECAESLEDGKNSTKSQVLFLQGYLSPQWVATIGSLCLTDPHYFNAHLRFKCRRDYFSSPTLPSGAENFITLRFITVGSREAKSETNLVEPDQDMVDDLRADGEKAMHRYEHDLQVGNNLKEGDSIVRAFSVLDEKHFLIEQEISLCLHKLEKDWILLVSIDTGNDLSNGPQGPWLTAEDRQSPSPWTILYPTIQHRPRIALRSESARPTDSTEPSDKFPQGAQLLAQHCGKLLDSPTMLIDPFYAMTDLFKFCAFSEVQFMNIMEAKIKDDTDHSSLQKEKPTLSNLLYCREIVQVHLARLQETIKVIRHRGGLQWPHVAEEQTHQYKKARIAKESLLEDYEHLAQRAETLLDRCSKGMDVIMSNVMLAESKRAIVQAQSVAKLTLVAFFYIPLSFTSSFFGMNFVQLGQGTLPIWIWFVVSVPVFLVSILFLLLDRKKIRAIRRSMAQWVAKVL